MLCKSTSAISTTTAIYTEKMGTSTPLAIGTRGTVGSLVRREIEYFRRVDIDSSSSTTAAAATSCKKQQQETRNCYSNSSRPSSRTRGGSNAGNASALGQLFMNWNWRGNKKKRRSNVNGSNRFVPNICSAVEVSESKRFDAIPGFRYQNIKDDFQGLHP